MQQVKSLWTPAQRRMDTHLLFAEDLRRGLSVGPGLTHLRPGVEVDRFNRVAVDLKANISSLLLRQLKFAHAEIISQFPAYQTLRAWVPLSRLEQVAGFAGVIFMEPALQPVRRVGAVATEGDVTHGVATARATFGVDGTGIKIGVLSDSIRYLAQSQASGELGNVTVLPGQEGLDLPASPPDEGEGTAMLELIHDLAPRAQLYFATASGGLASFATNILKLRAAGCDVIVDDVGYGNESPFQDAVIAQAVNAVTADGAMYFSSAGNDGNLRDGTSGTWEGDFVSGGAFPDVPRPGLLHDFGGGMLYNTITNGGSNRSLNLFWADPLGKSVNDYDLYVLDAEDNVVDFSLRTQDGAQDPYESIAKLATGDRVVIVLSSGAPRYLHLGVFGRFAISTPGSVGGHACATNAFCVAAVRARSSFPNPFSGGVKNSVENFSADGPRRMFFTPDGQPFTPGNFSSTGGISLQKPDIAAADGIGTSVPAESRGHLIFNPFFGTSAAAPHAAAIAALLKNSNPSISPAEIRAALLGTALDIELPGWDGTSGFGLVMADAALNRLRERQLPAITGFAPAQAAAGATLIVTGTNFSSVKQVQVAGLNAPFVIRSNSSIEVTVPSGATKGPISVTTPDTTVRSVLPFQAPGLPAIFSFSPLFARAGQTVSMFGTNFSGTGQVSFNGHPAATFTVLSPGEISVSVPSGAGLSGPITVTTPIGTARSSDNFTLAASPSISDLSILRGPTGQTLGIGGNNLDTTIRVTFTGGVSATNVTIDDPTLIWVRVPVGALSGPVTVVTLGGSATSADRYTVISRPSNDDFAGAATISGTTGSVSGDTTGASKEMDEPFHAGNPGGKSVWYRWTAPSTGDWSFDTRGRFFDTLVAIYMGDSVTNLTYISANDDADGNYWSRATFHALAGVTYSIALDGSWFGFDPSDLADAGSFTMEWAPAVSAALIRSIAPLQGGPGTPITVIGLNLSGVLSARMSGLRASFTVDSAGQLTVVVPEGATNSPVTLVFPSGTISSSAIFRVEDGVANDHFTNAIRLGGTSGKIFGNNSSAELDPGEPDVAGTGKTVWYVWKAPLDGEWKFDTLGSGIDTVLGIYSGAGFGSLRLEAQNDDFEGQIASSVRLKAVSQQTYYIRIDGAANDSGNFVLNWNPAPDPLILDFSPSAAAPGSKVLIAGKNFLGVTGVQFGRSSLAAFAIDSDSQITAVVPAGAESGRIRLLSPTRAGVSAEDFVVSGTRPSNDDLENPETIPGSAAIILGQNSGATRQASESLGKGTSHSVWYRWTAPSNGTWTVETSGANFKTVLSLFENGAAVGTVSTNNAFESRATLDALAGRTYLISIDSGSGATGEFLLKLAPLSENSALIYQASFETSEGYLGQRALQGQKSWVGSAQTGNGVVPRLFATGQQAYIGYGSALSAGRNIEVWRPLAYDPSGAGVVKFSVLMQVTTSSTGNFDRFSWRIRNRTGAPLFAITFNNATMEAGYSLDDGAGFRSSAVSFINYTAYHLEITMDFQHNLWSAYLGSIPLAIGKPITTSGAALNLDRISALWETQPSLGSGDNFMIFDDYRVVAQPAQQPQILLQPIAQTIPSGGDGLLSVVAVGGEPLQYQWTQNGADLSGQTNSALVLRSFSSAQAGTYSVKISNAFGTITSAAATAAALMVEQPRLTGRRNQGGFDIEFSKIPNAPYVIEASTNLTQWIPLGTISPTENVFRDSGSVTQRMRFYRARSQ